MKIFIAGSTGFIGRHLVAALTANGHEIIALTRNEAKGRRILGDRVALVVGDANQPGTWQDEIDGADAVINLVGEATLPKRWSTERKKLLYNSRIEPTKLIVEAIGRANSQPKVLISGSAVAFYGDSGGNELTESAAPGSGFAADMCRDWETAAQKAAEYGVRVVTLRTSFVLGSGGALNQMVRPFKMYAGGPMGSGSQFISWIHIDDFVALTTLILNDKSLAGAINMAAGAATNREFSRTLGRALGRPSWLPVPAVALKSMLGEGSQILLESQRLTPTKALGAGYEFKFPDLKEALTDAVGSGR